jgi:uncharacterized protein DUF2802
MPQLPQISPDLALLIGRAVFLVFCFVIAAFAFTRWRKASDGNTQLFFEQNTRLLQRLTALEERLAANQEEIASTRRDIATLGERMQEEGEQRRTPTPVNGPAPSYQLAIRLARSGAPREEIMASCGLSRQEAELVQRLHGPRSAKLAVAS